LDVLVDREFADIALIDVVTSHHAWIGARALWEPSHLREIVLSRLSVAAIGIASVGGALFPDACGGCSGAWIAVGDPAEAPRRVRAPIAPGLFREVPIAAARTISHGETAELNGGPCTIALDGERELEIRDPATHLAVRLNPQGPRVVDIDAALLAGVKAGPVMPTPR
jgi:hypothetical protein